MELRTYYLLAFVFIIVVARYSEGLAEPKETQLEVTDKSNIFRFHSTPKASNWPSTGFITVVRPLGLQFSGCGKRNPLLFRYALLHSLSGKPQNELERLTLPGSTMTFVFQTQSRISWKEYCAHYLTSDCCDVQQKP